MIHSGTAEDSLVMKFVLHVEQIPTVRLVKMTGLSVDASQHTLEILSKDVVMSAILTSSVDLHKAVIVKIIGVSQLVEEELVERMLIVRL